MLLYIFPHFFLNTHFFFFFHYKTCAFITASNGTRQSRKFHNDSAYFTREVFPCQSAKLCNTHQFLIDFIPVKSNSIVLYEDNLFPVIIGIIGYNN